MGYVNDLLFLNTSSVGAYVRFVETRDRLERHLGYSAASVLAGLRILRCARQTRVTLEVEGEKRVYRARLVFVAVGERIPDAPEAGAAGRGARRRAARGRSPAGGARHADSPARSRERIGDAVEAKPFGLDTALVRAAAAGSSDGAREGRDGRRDQAR